MAEPFILSTNELDATLANLRKSRVALVGDLCLDVYWDLAPGPGETSIETGLPTKPVLGHRITLGGGGNVAANLAALDLQKVACFGVVGPDPWGYTLVQLLQALNADHSGVLTQTQDWVTPAYVKPLNNGREESRFDFGTANRLHVNVADALVDQLERRLADFDIVVINEQFSHGLHSPYFRTRLNALMRKHAGKPFIADCRHYSSDYAHALLKVNADEARSLTSQQDPAAAARELYRTRDHPVFVTRGSRGNIVCDAQGSTEILGIQLLGTLDPVGAGDTALSAIAAGLASGCSPAAAGSLGNLAAAVTVRKINQTGTATPSEIRAMAQEANYIFQPELAEDPRRAAYLPGTQIEIIIPVERGRSIRHAIFDHDGTISVLRQGWEDVMETMMAKAILGERYRDADEDSYRACMARVRTYIDQTTGIQTWTQMVGLQSLVREFKMVPEAGIRSPAEYKAIYCSALLEAMKSRTAQLAGGELAVEDFVIKNAVAMLQKLSERGVTLYLASGTDAEDVVREAGVLGYAHLFKGGIFGATDDPSLEAKRMVLERIMREVGDAGALAVFGDGPVEMREARKKGALAVGVASDEVRRHGLNFRKRERLVKAGAHLIVPDFSQIEALLNALNLKA